MKKVIVVFLNVFIMLNLVGCSEYSKNYVDGSESAEQVLTEIIMAVENHETEALKKLFSTNAKMESSTLDSDIDKFIGMFDSEIISRSRAIDGGLIKSKSADHGKIKINIKSQFILKTSTQEFKIAIQHCTVDMFDRDNVGIHSINIINSLDWDDDYMYRFDPGITFEQGEMTNSAKKTD